MKNKVYIALESTGKLPNPNEEQQEALMIDQMAQKYGWMFVVHALGIKELTISQLANLQGILEGEFKKARLDKLRSM
jgi:hypothetical protein